MSTRSRKRKPVRIESERSQVGATLAKVRKLTKSHQVERDLRNRVFELEQQIAKLSRGDRGVALEVDVSPQATHVLDRLTECGFYGTTRAETASQLLTAKIRSEMAWLATGEPS